MGTRRKAREIIVQILYQLEINQCDVDTAMAAFWDNYHPPEDVREFSSSVLHGVIQRQKEIDKILTQSSDHWSLRRMPPVDRSILREAVFEILHCSDIPIKVTIDEAIELAKTFGSEKSGPFINGILDKVAHKYSNKGSSPT